MARHSSSMDYGIFCPRPAACFLPQELLTKNTVFLVSSLKTDIYTTPLLGHNRSLWYPLVVSHQLLDPCSQKQRISLTKVSLWIAIYQPFELASPVFRIGSPKRVKLP